MKYPNFIILFGLFIACSMYCASKSNASFNPTNKMDSIPKFSKTMDDSTYWSLMSEIKNHNSVEKSTLLTTRLVKMTDEDVISFFIKTQLFKNQLCNDSFFTASEIIAGTGESDFYWVCLWAISEGKEFYLKALKHPDDLEELIGKENLFYEELQQLPMKVFYDRNEKQLIKQFGERFHITDAIQDEIWENYEKGSYLNIHWDLDENAKQKLCPKLFALVNKN